MRCAQVLRSHGCRFWVFAEVFRELGREKKIRMIKLVMYVLIFVIVIYKCGPATPSIRLPDFCACVLHAHHACP